jgi:RNA-binding protein YhbY
VQADSILRTLLQIQQLGLITSICNSVVEALSQRELRKIACLANGSKQRGCCTERLAVAGACSIGAHSVLGMSSVLGLALANGVSRQGKFLRLAQSISQLSAQQLNVPEPTVADHLVCSI